MSILKELNECLKPLGIPIQTSMFSETAPDTYLIITPMSDILGLYADNKPEFETSYVTISLFIKNNYIRLKNKITRILLDAGFTITDRRYMEHEDDTGYHHYIIDVEKYYEI